MSANMFLMNSNFKRRLVFRPGLFHPETAGFGADNYLRSRDTLIWEKIGSRFRPVCGKQRMELKNNIFTNHVVNIPRYFLRSAVMFR